MRISRCLVYAALALPVLAFANDHQHSLEAHVHGAAMLNIALEEQQLELQLESPAMNIVGFEYQAKSSADKKAIEAAHSRLNDAAALFSLSAAAQCQLTSVSIENDLLKHTNEHDHQDQPSHDTDQQHSDITAHYHYHCTTPAELNSIDLAGFFKQFPQTEKAQVQLVTTDQQQGAELSHKHSKLNW